MNNKVMGKAIVIDARVRLDQVERATRCEADTLVRRSARADWA